MDQLELRDELLLLHLELMEGWGALGSVRLKQVSLLDKVDLQLLLKLRNKLLQLFSASISSLLDQLLQLRGAQA